MFAAGIIWALVAIAYAGAGDTHGAEIAVRHNLLEFAELFLFLLAAMTYINTMDERGVFDVLRALQGDVPISVEIRGAGVAG